jgi:hypothetical protein
MVTYVITGITAPRNNWVVPSATGFLMILMVLAASANFSETSKGTASQDNGNRRQFLTRITGADSSPGEATALPSG